MANMPPIPTRLTTRGAAFFGALGDAEMDVKAEAKGPSWARADWPPVPHDDLTQALTGEWEEVEVKAAATKRSGRRCQSGR